MITDTIDGILIDTDEAGFELILSGHAAEYHFRIHGVAVELMRAVDREIRPWWQEGQDAAATYVPPITEEDLEAYELGDPKRISLERMMNQ